jgi:hypothetical protein
MVSRRQLAAIALVTTATLVTFVARAVATQRVSSYLENPNYNFAGNVRPYCPGLPPDPSCTPVPANDVVVYTDKEVDNMVRDAKEAQGHLEERIAALEQKIILLTANIKELSNTNDALTKRVDTLQGSGGNKN